MAFERAHGVERALQPGFLTGVIVDENHDRLHESSP